MFDSYQFGMGRIWLFLLALVTWVSFGAGAQAQGNPRDVPATFTPSRTNFSITFGDITSNLAIITTTIMPGDALVIATDAAATADTGTLDRTDGQWTWTAPDEPGLARLSFEQNGEHMRLNVFVLTPFKNTEQTSLNGYRIGTYARRPFRGLATYTAPTGFIDLAHGPGDLKISPHFTLEQFLCKQQPGHDPTYLLVRPATLLKLETLLEAANEKGWTAATFHVMSGFRTPSYNASIGNLTTSSRHLFGGAADIWIDNDGDGQMDDLNGDGRISIEDAETLAALAEELAEIGGPNWPPGGIGIYRANAAHGPFVHIDARGYRARW